MVQKPEGADCINDGAFISDFRTGAMLGGWAPNATIELPRGWNTHTT